MTSNGASWSDQADRAPTRRRWASRPSQTDQLVYIQVTRGVALRDHVDAAGPAPTVFATSNRISPPSAADRAEWRRLRQRR